MRGGIRVGGHKRNIQYGQERQTTERTVGGGGKGRLCGACVSRVPRCMRGRSGGLSGGGEREEEEEADEARKKV